MVNTAQLAQIFSQTDGIVAAYFFGAQVSGKTDAFSDYDFAVLLPGVLADAGYLDQTSTAIYDKMVRFRNLVVHYYYRVDPEDIYNILTENLSGLQNWRTKLLEIIEMDANA